MFAASAYVFLLDSVDRISIVVANGFSLIDFALSVLFVLISSELGIIFAASTCIFLFDSEDWFSIVIAN
jgi:hypothetical protein